MSKKEAAVKTPSKPKKPSGGAEEPTVQHTQRTVLLEENHDLPLCRVQIVTRVGAATDVVESGKHPATGDRGHIGLCNFATELMRRGAGGRDRASLDEAVDALGASLQVLCWHDLVLFKVTALKDKIDDACRLLADVLLRPDFPEDEAERLRRELVASLDDLRDDDGSLMHRFFERGLYGEHPYGRPVGGTRESIDGYTTAQARAWHKHYIVEGDLVFGASGDLRPDEVDHLLSRHFGGVPKGPRREMPIPRLSPRRGRHVLIVDKPERTQSQILIGQPAPRWGEPDWLPLRIATTAFGGTFTARLMNEVRSKRGLSYGASARLGNGRGERALYAHVFPSAEQTPETIELVLRLFEEWATAGLRPGELDFAKSYMQKGHAFSVQTAEDRLMLRTSLILSDLPEENMRTFPARVGAVDEAAVQRAMKRLTPDGLLITLVATARTVEPALRALPSLRNATFEIVPYDSF